MLHHLLFELHGKLLPVNISSLTSIDQNGTGSVFCLSCAEEDGLGPVLLPRVQFARVGLPQLGRQNPDDVEEQKEVDLESKRQTQ